ncbi:MAG: hypothetical protein ABIC82_07025 [bacterium]
MTFLIYNNIISIAMRGFTQSDNLFNESVKLLAQCPVCRKQYAQSNAKIVNEVEDAYLLHVRCGRCNSSVLALIFMTGMGITSMGMLTDLNSCDLNKFKRWENISQDEVLEMYKYTKICQLF